MLTAKAARFNRGLSSKEAAERLGITRQHLYNIESGKTDPKVSLYFKMCELYGLQSGDLIFLPPQIN